MFLPLMSSVWASQQTGFAQSASKPTGKSFPRRTPAGKFTWEGVGLHWFHEQPIGSTHGPLAPHVLPTG